MHSIYRTVYGCKVMNSEKCAFSRVFQPYVYEKRPRRIAPPRSFTMRFRLAVFAKIAMDGCAPGHVDYSHSTARLDFLI